MSEYERLVELRRRLREEANDDEAYQTHALAAKSAEVQRAIEALLLAEPIVASAEADSTRSSG